MAYVVAVFAILLSGTSALTLFYAVRHLDPPEVKPDPVKERVGV